MVVHIASTGIQVDNAIDLRRKCTRDMAEIIADHAQWAQPEERAIIHAIYRDGLSAQRVAHLRCESPRRVRARVRRIVARLVSDRFRFVVRPRDEWPNLRRRVASGCVMQGMSMREAARFLQITLHQVRREMGVVRTLMVESSARTNALPAPPPPLPGGSARRSSMPIRRMAS